MIESFYDIKSKKGKFMALLHELNYGPYRDVVEKFRKAISEDPGFRLFFYDYLLSWSDQTRIKHGIDDDNIYIQAFLEILKTI